MSGFDGSVSGPSSGDIVASNGRVHDEMLEAIREFRAPSPGA
jgi:hypothetical protein